MAKLEFFFLGHPQIHLNGQPVTDFNTRKDRALLAYLAVTGAAHSREALAGLLWPELPEAKARRNLRHTLSALQKVIGPQWLMTERDVALTQEQPWSVDTQTLRKEVNQLLALANGEPRRYDPAALEALNRVLNLYRGEFLHGFYVRDATNFEEWVLAQREEYRLLTLRGLEGLVEHCLTQGAYEQGLVATRRLLQLEPWSEPAHCLQMQLLAQSGRRAEALAQYERCRQILADELKVEPLPATTALYQQIQAGHYNKPIALRTPALPSARPPALAPKATIPNNLFTPLAGFVGRQNELAFISRRLATPDGRLMTIVGPGGIGKTSLALALGQHLLHTQQANFPDGIFFIPLLDIGVVDDAHKEPTAADHSATGEAILRTIAEQIGYKLEPEVSPAAQLQTYLRSRRLLLILDNFEHLLGGTEMLVTLLTKTPQLKALVTSRARLNVRGENVLPLAKLSLPTAAYDAAVVAAQVNPAHLIQEEAWQTSEAVAMFVQRAQQFDPAFTVSAETIGPIGQICQLVEGLPLGIELAASMLPQLSCPALADMLATSLDVLAAETRDLPSEQRTLRAVFERSWRLLSPQGQLLLARLSLFPGSFRQEAAEYIVGASPILLRRLLDQSLVNKVGDERYALHRTVHAFAQQKLQQWPEQSATLQVQYAHFYLAFLANMERGLLGAAQAITTEQIQADLDNIRTAWRWAANHQMFTELKLSSNPLFVFYDQQGSFLEAIELCDQALRVLIPLYEAQQQKSGTELAWLVGRLQTFFAVCCNRLGRFAPAQAAFEASWQILQTEDKAAAAICLAQWGAWLKGQDPQRSAVLLTEALQLAQAHSARWLQAVVSQALGETVLLLGDYAAAEAYITAGYTLAEQLNWPRALISGHKALGRIHLLAGRYRQAEEHLRVGIELANRYQFRVFCLESVITLGEALRFQGRLVEAKACFAEGWQLAALLGSAALTAFVQWEEGCLAEQCGDYPAAKTFFTDSLAAITNTPWWAHALPTPGWALIGLGELAEAQAYFQKVLAEAEAHARLPISLDAQLGLLYIQQHQLQQSGQAQLAWPPTGIDRLQTIYRHPAATAETRQRIDQLATQFALRLQEKPSLETHGATAMQERPATPVLVKVGQANRRIPGAGIAVAGAVTAASLAVSVADEASSSS